MSDMQKPCNDNDGFIESFIKSPQVKQLLRKREYCFTDFQKAAIIYHSNVNLPQMHHSLRVIADITCDEDLKAQITELIDQDTKSYDRFVHDSKGYIYKLIAKEEESDGETCWFDIGYYDNGSEAKQAGTGSGGAFRIASRDEWRNLCDMATDGRHTLDWNDACIVVNDIETDFRHEHVNPIYLELIN